MQQYEVIFEDGTHSVCNYESDEEALSACGAHHERATKGEPALADVPNVPAVRIVRVLKYDSPPGDAFSGQSLSADVAKSELAGALEAATTDGVTDLADLAARIRDLSNPFDNDAGPHDSKYRAKEVDELTLPWGDK